MAKIVTYDLKRADIQDYEILFSAIKKYIAASRITESCWLVVANQSCEEVRDNLIGYIHSQDRLFVVDISDKDAAWQNSMCSDDFIRQNINR